MIRITALILLVASSLARRTAVAQDPTVDPFAAAARHGLSELPPPGRADSERMRESLLRLYDSASVRPLWTGRAGPTPQALEVITALSAADTRGLLPADYDADSLRSGAAGLATAPGDVVRQAEFDIALSRSLIRFLSDLHMGRVDPRSLGVELPDTHQQLDLAALALMVSRASNPAAVIASAEPPYAGYAALIDELARYRRFVADPTLRPPALTGGAIRPGDRYEDAANLARFLTAVGDLGPGVPLERDAAGVALYNGALLDGVIEFQRRHGLEPDGVIGRATRAALAVPLARRARQIELTLERWRWLPDRPPSRYAVVNVPAFRLLVFEQDSIARQPVLAMNVIVGQADGRHATPLFTATMREVVLRPYWDVPPRIARVELLPPIRRDPAYLEREGLEIVHGGDYDAVVHPSTDESLDRVALGTLRLRQRPGPNNALGLVKFVFPNRYNVYMHGTPARALFARARRDFSHGCIRVEDPTALAEHVLRGQTEWSRGAIEAAMNGDSTVHIPLARPVGVYILYATAVAGDGGAIRFHADLYGHDARLERALARPAPSSDSR